MLCGADVRTDNQVIRAVALPPFLRKMKHIDHMFLLVREGTKREEITVTSAEGKHNLAKTTSRCFMMKKNATKKRPNV